MAGNKKKKKIKIFYPENLLDSPPIQDLQKQKKLSETPKFTLNETLNRRSSSTLFPFEKQRPHLSLNVSFQ